MVLQITQTFSLFRKGPRMNDCGMLTTWFLLKVNNKKLHFIN